VDETRPPQPEKTSTFKKIIGWVGGITAILGLLASLSGGVQWIRNHWTQHSEIKTEIAVAESQAQRDEYEAAVATYQDILKKDPQNHQAADEQVTAAMRWIENFSVTTGENQSASAAASPKLNIILPILDAGLARAKGSRAADILAHIGWTHWLNWHIAEREFSPAAEQNLRQAISMDPANVYANAMLGNWLLQNGGSLSEATDHFNTAIKTGKERPWIRNMQVSVLIYNETPQAGTELIKTANDMRKNHETLSDSDKHRILAFNYELSSFHKARLMEVLSAVPPDESWATYLWLDDQQASDSAEAETQQRRRDYIHARILELSGKQQEALASYKLLQAKLKSSDFTLVEAVDDSIKRLAAK